MLPSTTIKVKPIAAKENNKNSLNTVINSKNELNNYGLFLMSTILNNVLLPGFLDYDYCLNSDNKNYILPYSDHWLYPNYDPYLYKLVSLVKQNGKTIDSVATKFGVRTVYVDVEAPDAESAADGTYMEVDGYINNPYYANNITFTSPQGDISSSANTIQLAIQDLETRKAALAGDTFTGVVTGAGKVAVVVA